MGGLRVLELRIHGIANSPPADMLGTTADEVERKDGDDQGSFWRVKSTAPDASKTPPYRGAEIVTEAYSWGKQARSGGSAFVLIGRAIVHLSWLFVLPFGLCNLAYWARRDIKGNDEDPRWWAGGDGAVLIRVFALLQTLFYTVGFLTVFVHLIALQCFPLGTDFRVHQMCAALPAWLDLVSGWSSTARAALFSIVPILVIFLIYIIGRRARGLFNPQRSFDDDARPRPRDAQSRENGEAALPRPALLSSLGFWHRARVAQTSERAHFAGAIALTVFLLPADALMDALSVNGPLGALPGEVFRIPGSAFVVTIMLIGLVLLVASFVIAAAAGLSGERWSRRSKRGWSTSLLVLSVATYVAWIVWALLVARDDVIGAGQFPGDGALRGLVIAPIVIAAVGALIAVSSLSWGYRWRRRLVIWALLPLSMCSAVAAVWPWAEATREWVRPWASYAAVVFILAAIAIAYLPFRDPDVRVARRFSGWHGNGSSVALLMALFSSLVISSLLVLGAHAWLAEDDGGSRVAESWRIIETDTVEPENLEPIQRPEFHQLFAGMLVVVLLVFVAVTVAGMLAALLRFPAFSLPGPSFDPELGGIRRLTLDPERARISLAQGARDDAKVALEYEYPPNETHLSGRVRAVADARRVAALAQRGEPLLRVLAILTAFTLVPLAIPFFSEEFERLAPGVWGTLADTSGWALGLLALAAVTWVVTNAVTSTERPLGLVWDIICFFPRAGHPFTPPCYGERAVPEVTKRIQRWIKDEGADARVILSAHSMGATIAVGALLSLQGRKEDDALNRISLLTHGVQLRPYFSRFFPEVFGARVLGIRGTTGPALFGGDPWREQVLDDFHSAALPLPKDGDPRSVVALLGADFSNPDEPVSPRWRNLWRRTDFLGFPVTGYWSDDSYGVNENPIDRGATERSPRSYLWTVARHNDYLSTEEYVAARRELINDARRELLRSQLGKRERASK